MIFARRPRQEATQRTTLDAIESAEHHLIPATWKGAPCGLIKVRVLSDIEIQAIGNFSLIETDQYRWSRAPGVKVAWSELLAYAEQNVKICKAALVSPSYDEIFAVVGKSGFHAEVKEQIEHINAMLSDMPVGPARQELEGIRDSLILAWEVILPGDFIIAVVKDALKIERTDIKKVTEDMLYNAAILAERGNKAPHEYIHGIFSDFNLRDIDTQAWIIFDSREAKKREQTQQMRDA